MGVLLGLHLSATFCGVLGEEEKKPEYRNLHRFTHPTVHIDDRAPPSPLRSAAASGPESLPSCERWLLQTPLFPVGFSLQN
ncbi:hypothetical protein MUK42_13845 [Musa troglodytarum]|uniref:Secreted protein n=1 Tax=Musa troglodytarum TaxID=320322 RepID=A0A9E7HC52_9LILI|nr:hypothetical protein MUK42_13845 [Musa troglodytarum]URE27237.1 hypothetical protein MUK42_13845 [Musa troglodytarum]